MAVDPEHEFDWSGVGISTGIGAVEGALTVLCPAYSLAISAGASALDATIDGLREGDSASEMVINVGLAGLFGAAAGDGGSAIAKGGKLIDDAVHSIGNAFIKKGIHPSVKKAARKIVKKAGKYIAKSFGSDLADELGYGLAYGFSSRYTNQTFRYAFSR